MRVLLLLALVGVVVVALDGLSPVRFVPPDSLAAR